MGGAAERRRSTTEDTEITEEEGSEGRLTTDEHR
jgi:hypothetical protein